MCAIGPPKQVTPSLKKDKRTSKGRTWLLFGTRGRGRDRIIVLRYVVIHVTRSAYA